MNEILFFVLFLSAWIALNRWILPAMGIPTCMSGGCSTGSCRVPGPLESAVEKRPSPEHEAAKAP